MALLLNAGDTVSRSYSYTQPSPLHPIYPSECGERTGNLFDENRTTGIADNCYIKQNGVVVSANDYYLSYPIEVDTNSDYTWNFNNSSSGGIIKPTHTAPSVGFYDENNNLLSAASHDSYVRYFSFTTPNNCAYIRVSVYKTYKNEAVLNVGSTPIDYEPYGYKIPISSANTTTNVYLGEVETTRKIKKLVLTGGTVKEYVYDPMYTRFYFVVSDILGIGVRLTPLYCTHYQNISDGRPVEDVPNNSIYTGGGADTDKVFIKITDYTSVTDFKAYLQQQYANGTPVTIWYVLATEETGIVNEPLRKIGDYADAVSGITIPTITGKDTFDVETTLKPSEVELTYTGWHDASAKEWDGSQWQ